MHIESDYPLWLVLPLVALAIFVVWALYFRKQPEQVLNRPVRILLGISRMMALIITGLLIISPLIRTTVNRPRKAWFVVARDNSVSMRRDSGQPARRSETGLDSAAVAGELKSRFRVREVLFGSQTTEGGHPDFSEKATDPSLLFDYLRTFARTHELGGVLLQTDGVATRGINFSEAARNFPYPVYVLASGDSTQFPDVRIEDVACNEWVRRNSLFPVRIYYNTGDYKGRGFKLQITDQSKVLAEKYLETRLQSSAYEEFMIEAADKGVMRLTARIIPDEPDKNLDNNTRAFSVRTIEKEGSILCLYESPHPDIDALLETVRNSGSLEIKVSAAADYQEDGKDYNLIILHGLPSAKHPVTQLMARAAAKQIPILFIIGKTTDPNLFNSTGRGMVIDSHRKSPEAARGILNTGFTLFTLPDNFGDQLNSWPPLDLEFETYRPVPGSQILLRQKILNIDLPDPLLSFSSGNGLKSGFICGEGIWRWRIYDYLENQNHDIFGEFLLKSLRYLLTDANQERFRIIVPGEPFADTPVRINAHLLNNSLEPVNDPDVTFTLTDSTGMKTTYQMGRVNEYYELIVSGFKPGVYQYEAETRLGAETFRKDGRLTLVNRPVEQADPVADFESLRHIAKSTGGEFFAPGSEKQVLTALNGITLTDMRFDREFKWYDLINFRWLLLILSVLLTLEWFLRRWFGIR